MRRIVAVLFLLVAFGAFLGPLLWAIASAAVVSGLTTGEVTFDGGPAGLLGRLCTAMVAFLLYRHFDRPTADGPTSATPQAGA